MQNTITNKHKYQSFANQTLQWLDLDSESLWETNMQDPQRRAHLVKYGFDQSQAVTYQMNSHGFRSAEFDSGSGFIALGCSFTCGIGLPATQIWPSLVGQAVGLTSWNLGIGGAGLDTCFRMLYTYIDMLSPKFVMLLTPDQHRFEIHDLDQPRMIMHASNYNSADITTIKKFWFANEQNTLINHTKNLLAIQQLCASKQVKLIVKNLYPDLLGTIAPHEPWPASRDLQHVGYPEHRHCADQFLQALHQN